MFIIKPEKAADWQHALFMLSYYHVDISTRSNGEDAKTVYMIVECGQLDTHGNDVRAAEMAFQMNWYQVGSLCPDCEAIPNECSECELYSECDTPDEGPCRPETCGHLTFNKPINPAF